jgi:hypothetical protein
MSAKKADGNGFDGLVAIQLNTHSSCRTHKLCVNTSSKVSGRIREKG